MHMPGDIISKGLLAAIIAAERDNGDDPDTSADSNAVHVLRFKSGTKPK